MEIVTKVACSRTVVAEMERREWRLMYQSGFAQRTRTARKNK